jgi:hypothetical protein
LKIDPWWDEQMQSAIIERIRNNMPQATLFKIPDEIIPLIKVGVKKWISAR